MNDEEPIRPMEDEPKTTEEHESDGQATQDSETNNNIDKEEK